MLSLLFLAASLSLDALGIGATYGIRRIALPISALLVLAAESAFLMTITLLLGSHLTLVLSPGLAHWLGYALFIAVGLWLFLQGMFQTAYPAAQSPSLLETPSACDQDGSAHIDPKEALLLGLLLSIDSMGAGIGVGVSGGALPWFPLYIACFQVLFLSLGAWLGSKTKRLSGIPESLWSILSGLMLIGIGWMKLFF